MVASFHYNVIKCKCFMIDIVIIAINKCKPSCDKMKICKTRLVLCLLPAISLFYLMHKFYHEEWSIYYRYQYSKLDDQGGKIRDYKIILLWTSYQGTWRGWTGGLGHDQIIRDCNNDVMNGACVVTSDKSLINSADAVLFSLQDLKQV